MKLKEKFKESLIDTIINSNGRCNPVRDADVDVLCGLMTKVTKEDCYTLEIPSIRLTYTKLKEKPNEEEIRAFSEGIIKEYGLDLDYKTLKISSGKDYYYPRFPEFNNNISLLDTNCLAFGDNIIGYLGEYDLIDVIIYNSKSKNIAKEIWIKHSLECKRIVDKYKTEIEKSYEVSTIISGPAGYDPVVNCIFPTVSLKDPDFMNNYNNDFPESRVEDFIKMDKGGIMIFNGMPGCGKSTYLKSLIFKYPDINFVITPQYLLLNQENFRQLLFNMSYGEKDCIYIIEDCEQLLVQRENNNAQFSSIIGDILNYTDGIFGDLTRTKFIFTFNTNLNNIDKAILRPGRLFLRYEFLPLSGENLKKMADKLGYELTEEEIIKGIPLSELYYKAKTSDLEVCVKKKNKVGFIKEERDV